MPESGSESEPDGSHEEVIGQKTERDSDDLRARQILKGYSLWELGKVASVFSSLIEDESFIPRDTIPSGLAEAYIILRDDIVPSQIETPDTTFAQAVAEPMSKQLTNEALQKFDQHTLSNENQRVLYPDLEDARKIFEALTHLNTSGLTPDQIEEVNRAIQQRKGLLEARLRTGSDMRDMGEASTEILKKGSITDRLQSFKYKITAPAAEMLHHPDFTIPDEDTTLRFAKVNVGDLALTSRAPTYQEIIDHAQRIGLKLCPPWTAPAYLLARRRTRQRGFEQTGLAMEPMALGREEEPSIFTVSGEVLGARSGRTANIQENLLFVNPQV